jgi:hypothetical protein
MADFLGQEPEGIHVWDGAKDFLTPWKTELRVWRWWRS